MKNTTFSSTFVATLTLVLMSSILLTACAPADTVSETIPAAEQQETSQMQNPSSGASDQAATTEVQDGEISLEPTYTTPGGQEKIEIMLVMANGVVADAQATSLANHSTSKLMQAGFVEEFSESVIGKSLSELESIDRIGGASLTTGAFRRAIMELNQTRS